MSFIPSSRNLTTRECKVSIDWRGIEPQARRRFRATNYAHGGKVSASQKARYRRFSLEAHWCASAQTRNRELRALDWRRLRSRLPRSILSRAGCPGESVGERSSPKICEDPRFDTLSSGSRTSREEMLDWKRRTVRRQSLFPILCWIPRKQTDENISFSSLTM